MTQPCKNKTKQNIIMFLISNTEAATAFDIATQNLPVNNDNMRGVRLSSIIFASCHLKIKKKKRKDAKNSGRKSQKKTTNWLAYFTENIGLKKKKNSYKDLLAHFGEN